MSAVMFGERPQAIEASVKNCEPESKNPPPTIKIGRRATDQDKCSK